MLKFKIQRGLRFLTATGRRWTVDRLMVSRRVQLIDDSGVVESLTPAEIYRRWMKSEWLIDPESAIRGNDCVYHAIERDLNSYSTDEQEQALFRFEVISPLFEIARLPTTVLREHCSKFKIPRTEKPPHPRCVRRWLRSYKVSRDITKLIDQRPCRRPVDDSRLSDLFETALESAFLKRERPMRADAIDELKRLLKEFNATTVPDERIKVPSRATLYRRLQDIDAILADRQRFGRFEADRMHRTALKKTVAKGVLDRIELDHTQLDVILIDIRTGAALGRPWLTIAIDVHSKIIYGFYLSFDPPSSNSVMQCLLCGVLPKEELLKKHTNIVNEWPVYGFPVLTVFDNGLDAHAERVLTAIKEMGAAFIQYCPRKRPWYKGNVERVFRTLNSLIHLLPGTTFSSPKHRRDYKSEKQATLNLDELEHVLLKWIVDVYHIRTHRTTKMPPLERWNRNVQNRDIYLPASCADLQLLLGIPRTRHLHHYGIENDHIRYNSPELQDVLRGIRKYTANDTSSPTVDYKFYDETVEYVDVLDPDSKTYLRVGAVDYEYAKGLKRRTHLQIIKGLQEEFGNNWRRDDQLSALREIRDFVTNAQRSKRRAKAAQKNRCNAKADHNVDTGRVDAAIPDIADMDLPSFPSLSVNNQFSVSI